MELAKQFFLKTPLVDGEDIKCDVVGRCIVMAQERTVCYCPDCYNAWRLYVEHGLTQKRIVDIVSCSSWPYQPVCTICGKEIKVSVVSRAE